MQVKNEYVKIKLTSKEITLHNYIYDRYLSLFSKSQYVLGLLENLYEPNINLNYQKTLNFIYIKFDTELEDYTDASIEDFDVYTTAEKKTKTTSKNSVSMFYTYNPLKIANINEYYGKKITALGFGDGDNIMACIDISLYNIYMLQGEDIRIMRKDIITTDGECVGYDYPVHLSPYEDYEKALYKDNTGYLSCLYSVGFGSQKGLITSEERIFNKKNDGTLDVKYINDLEFSINLKKEIERSYYPQNTKYLASTKYPLALNALREIYPQKNYGMPSNYKYPLISNYKFIILKYRLFYYDYSLGGIAQIFTDKYYTINIPFEVNGIFEFRTKMERKED